MGLFSRNWEKPGPGVKKDEPRKKGAARFFELFFRDFWELIKINLLFCLSVLPSLIAFLFSVLGFFGEFSGIAFVLSLLLAFPVGGALTAYYYYITKLMRDDPSYVWYEFKRKFGENFRQAAFPGILCTAFVYAQVLLWGALLLSEQGTDIVWLFVALISLLIFGMITPYIYLHLAYIELKTLGILKNSILMSFGYMPRSFMGAFLGGILWVACLMLFPVSLLFVPIIVLIGISLSILLTLMWIWKPFDEHFKIEEKLIARIEEEMEKEVE